jgi:ribosome modulation factor
MDGVSDVDPDTGEIKGLPSPDQVKPTDEELKKAFDDGYQAASEGKPQSDCPIIRSELVIEWVKGWKAWHEENAETTEEVEVE